MIIYGVSKAGRIYRELQPTVKSPLVKAKTCSKCGETLPLDDFQKDRTAKDGRRARCKQCANVAVREHRKKSKS